MITIEGNNIQQVKTTKYLEVILDETPNWEEHIKSLESKLQEALIMIMIMMDGHVGRWMGG